MRKWTNRRMRAAATVLEVIISLGLFTFFLFFPVAINVMTVKRNLLEDVKTIALQDASREGAVDQAVIDDAKANVQADGLDPSALVIQSNATAQNPIYVPSMTPIQVTVYYPATQEVNFLNGLARIIGAGPTEVPFQSAAGAVWYYKFSGSVLSEKVQY